MIYKYAQISQLHTFADNMELDSVETDVSDFSSKLFRSSSLVSAPDFFTLGDPTERDTPSLKVDVVLILSA